jgi:RNA polymerase-binding protein DksA
VATKVPARAPAKAPAKAPARVPAKAPAKASPRQLAVRADESPWTAKELAAVRTQLEEEANRLRTEIAAAEEGIADLLRDSGDGAGDDQADAGTKTFEREHEMSLANNSRGMLLQAERALHRIEDGTYGVCESCGQPIGKARLQAFPRATLCVSCKQKEERR